MKSAAVLILVASVLGTNGETFHIDAGRLVGLRVGDTGAVFYELTVRDEVRRVEVGSATVAAVEDATATLEAPAGKQVREGYRVEFSVPAARLDRRQVIPRPADEAVELRAQLEGAEARIRELERELESSRGARTELERSLDLARAGQSTARRSSDEQAELLRAAEQQARDFEERLVASKMHAGEALAELQAELGAAQAKTALLEAEIEATRVEAVEPAPAQTDPQPATPQLPTKPPAVESKAVKPPATVEPPAEAEVAPIVQFDPAEGMTRLESGRYAIGLPVSEASFYNQTPRFSRQIDGLWIDSLPVMTEDFVRVSGAAPPPGEGGFQTGVTFAEAAAYCGAIGKRLPTEVEWEAAFTSSPLEAQPSMLEWTSSWYEAYPGNDRVEVDYGQRFRVIRASSGSRRDRRYMVPTDRDGSVGFRCLRPDSPE